MVLEKAARLPFLPTAPATALQMPARLTLTDKSHFLSHNLFPQGCCNGKALHCTICALAWATHSPMGGQNTCYRCVRFVQKKVWVSLSYTGIVEVIYELFAFSEIAWGAEWLPLTRWIMNPLPSTCPHQIHMLKIQPPVSQNVTIFGDKIFKS